MVADRPRPPNPRGYPWAVPGRTGAFQKKLLAWYAKNKRPLPWRQTRDPYAILVAEVLLQQTRVDQALNYYHRFLEKFPTLRELACAGEEEVLKVWEGAGYYRRARQLVRLAQELGSRELPRTFAGLLELPGIGPYTAAAVASIAFGEPVAVVDGNVRRVLARLWAQENPTPAWLRAEAQKLLDHQDPGTWNQALMELGALVCGPKRPRCSACPWAAFCAGRSDAHRFPQPRPRRAKVLRVWALAARGRQGFIFEKREGSLLGGLWGFPLVHEAQGVGKLLERYGVDRAWPIGTVRHSFTHRDVTVEVYLGFSPLQGDDPRVRPLSRLDRKILVLAEAAVVEGAPRL